MAKRLHKDLEPILQGLYRPDFDPEELKVAEALKLDEDDLKIVEERVKEVEAKLFDDDAPRPLSPEEAAQHQADIERGDRSRIPGAVRASLGIYNTREEMDILVEALTHVARGNYTGTYALNPATGAYCPQDYQACFDEFFSFR